MKRPRSHEIGNLGEIRTAQVFAQHGWIQEKIQSDYGADYFIQRTDSGTVTADIAFIQVKSTSRFSKNQDSAIVASIRVECRHLEFWSSVGFPMFLAVVTIPANDVYIVDARAIALQAGIISGHIALEGMRKTIYIPRLSIASPDRMASICRLVSDFWRSIRSRLASLDKSSPAGTTSVNRLVATTALFCEPVGVLPNFSANALSASEVVGYLIGGPIGGAVGRVIGEQIRKSNSRVESLDRVILYEQLKLATGELEAGRILRLVL